MKNIALAIVAICLSGPAVAGGIVNTTVLDPAMPIAYEENFSWTGNYAGLLLGYGRMERATVGTTDSENGFGGGFTLGRMHDFGTWVGAIEVLMAPGLGAEVNGREIEWGAGVRAKAGRKFGASGRWLAFGSAGIGRVKTSELDSDSDRTTNGYLYGVGVSYFLQTNVAVSAEWLHAEKNGAGDANANGAVFGISYKF